MKNIKIIDEIKIDEEGIKIPQYSLIEIEDNYIKRYRKYIYLITNLKLAAIHVMEYLVENMDKHNMVYTTEKNRLDIIEFYNKQSNGSLKYSDITIKTAIAKLVKVNLLIQQQRGMYLVNPKYFFNGTENDRVKLLKIIIEIEKGTNIDKLIIKNE